MLDIIFYQTVQFLSDYSKCSKISNTFLKEMLVFGDGIHKMLVSKQTGKTLIRLLLKTQSDLGLRCLSRLFWQASSVQNFRKFTVA